VKFLRARVHQRQLDVVLLTVVTAAIYGVRTTASDVPVTLTLEARLLHQPALHAIPRNVSRLVAIVANVLAAGVTVNHVTVIGYSSHQYPSFRGTVANHVTFLTTLEANRHADDALGTFAGHVTELGTLETLVHHLALASEVATAMALEARVRLGGLLVAAAAAAFLVDDGRAF